jgi:hypothetical protein
VENFHPIQKDGSGAAQPQRGKKQTNEIEDGEEEEEEVNQESGGFCQPASLATFVATQLKLNAERQPQVASPCRLKRPLNDLSSEKEIDDESCPPGREAEVKRSKSESSPV